MLAIERQYSDDKESEEYTLSAYIYLLEKICGLRMDMALQKTTEQEKREGQG